MRVSEVRLRSVSVRRWRTQAEVRGDRTNREHQQRCRCSPLDLLQLRLHLDHADRRRGDDEVSESLTFDVIRAAADKVHGLPAIRVIESPYVPRFKLEQFRFPRSKKRRIRKKWAARQQNFKQVPNTTLYYLPKQGVIYCHPESAAKLYAAMMEPTK